MNAVTVYASGLVSCSACAPAEMSIEDVTAAVNAQNPTGLSHGWHLSEGATFADGTPMPAVCEKEPVRRHYLFSCWED